MLLTKKILLALCILVLAACSAQNQVKPGDPYFAPVIAMSNDVEAAQQGSLFVGTGGMELFSDRKANRVGDIITIVLNERTVSQKTNNVSVTKDSDMSFNAGPIFGRAPSISNLNLETDIQQERDFSGAADADQSNSLQGNITVTVVDIMPNGNLVVRGEKWMTLNRGDEYIRISGILRAEDVDPNNTAPSNRLANARISYSGTGELAESNQMGWLTRFFNTAIWPF